MRIVGMRWRWLTVSLLSLTAMVGLRGDNASSIRALAPVEIVASGFQSLAGVAVEADGAVLVTDRAAGTLTRIDQAGHRHVLLDSLHGPTGVAVDPAGGVLVIEYGGKRLLRLASDGSITTVASSLRQARSLAVGSDGRVWVSIRRAVGRDRAEEDAGRRSEYVVARLDESGALTPLASGFIDVQAVAAGAGAVYVAMAGLSGERGRTRTTLARIPVRPDGSAGVVEPLVRDSHHGLRALAIDAVGDLFFSARPRDGNDNGARGREGVILKRQASGDAGTFASGLRHPVALALSPTGDLVAVERKHPGRVLRFRAPPAPWLGVPAFTNQTPLALNGRAEAGARIAVAPSIPPGPAFGFTVADATGAFVLPVPLAANATNRISAVATGVGGAGLVSTPTTVDIVHDAVPPSLTIEEPVAGVHMRGPTSSSARAEDDRSGVAALLWALVGADVAGFENPTPEQPFSVATTVATDAATEGPHAVHVTAVDRAGNSTARSTLIIVDRTPPETLIVGGPADRITARTITFVLSGTDAWSDVGDLDYAWRLDEDAWSAFDAAALVQLNGLVVGTHRFEVRARDRAGNEDPTAAGWAFTVTALQIRITEPAPGAVITASSVWIRGTVDSGGREVGVAVVLPAEFRAELPVTTFQAPTEAGTFAVEIPVRAGITTLAVTATDVDGGIARDETTISVVLPASTPGGGFEASPGAGTEPHTVSFSVPAGEVERFALDLESDGSTEYEGVALANQTFTYARPGIYVATLRVTNVDGQVSAYRTAVEVYERATLDVRLQATWRGFKDALRSGDVARAVTFIHGDRRAKWQDYFLQFPPDLFAATDTVFTDLALLEVAPGGAECEMMREVDGLLYSFPVSFLIDIDGRWRLWQF